MDHQCDEPEHYPYHFFEPAQEPDREARTRRISKHREDQCLAALLAHQFGGDEKGRTLDQQAERLDQQCDPERRRLMQQAQQEVDFDRPEAPREQEAQAGEQKASAIALIEVEQDRVGFVG